MKQAVHDVADVQDLQFFGQFEHVDDDESRKSPIPHDRQAIGSVGEQEAHPAKHFVQFVVPVMITNPEAHIPSSHFPAPLVTQDLHD